MVDVLNCALEVQKNIEGAIMNYQGCDIADAYKKDLEKQKKVVSFIKDYLKYNGLV